MEVRGLWLPDYIFFVEKIIETEKMILDSEPEEAMRMNP
jgi:hypothetical protein